MAQDITYYEKNDEKFADVRIEDLTFICRVAGLENTGETVILLHGFPETSRMWYHLIKILLSLLHFYRLNPHNNLD